VSTEVDFDSTVVGGPRSLILQIADASGLEVLEVEQGDSLACDADLINVKPS
jgi:hypothetical protein